jgi:flagellar biosynthetic protein FliR
MSLLTSLLLGRVVAYSLVLSRISGFVVASPFPGAYVGQTQRVGLVLALSWAATLFAPDAGAGHELSFALLVPLALELGCGLIVGLAFRFVMAAFEIAGSVFSQSVGLAAGTTYNPGTESQTSALEQLITLMSLAIAVAIGAHRVAIAYLLESFRALPVGGTLHLAATTSTIVDLSTEALRVGLRLAMPVLAVGLIIQIALALLARAAPSMQIFNVGLTVMLASGLMLLLSSLDAVGSGMVAHLGTLGSTLERVLGAMKEAPP